MGLFFRKGFHIGPFRINFSKSGIGISLGVPGLRVGSGPQGSYVRAEKFGFGFRKNLKNKFSVKKDGT